MSHSQNKEYWSVLSPRIVVYGPLLDNKQTETVLIINLILTVCADVYWLCVNMKNSPKGLKFYFLFFNHIFLRNTICIAAFSWISRAPYHLNVGIKSWSFPFQSYADRNLHLKNLNYRHSIFSDNVYVIITWGWKYIIINHLSLPAVPAFHVLTSLMI